MNSVLSVWEKFEFLPLKKVVDVEVYLLAEFFSYRLEDVIYWLDVREVEEVVQLEKKLVAKSFWIILTRVAN